MRRNDADQCIAAFLFQDGWHVLDRDQQQADSQEPEQRQVPARSEEIGCRKQAADDSDDDQHHQ